MECKYFGVCGGCSIGHLDYQAQLQYKLEREEKRFSTFDINTIDIIKSEDSHFRNRAEFRLFKTYNEDKSFRLDYAMTSLEKKIMTIDSCPMVVNSIYELMPQLKAKIESQKILHEKVYSIEFLSSLSDDMLVTIIYHKKLDNEWKEAAKSIENEFNIKVIGRSRKQKEILSVDYIKEELIVAQKKYSFYYKEGGFTQPNQKVNEQMIEWVIKHSTQEDDLCELYCGGGNFTIPLSDYFYKVLATEVSKTSIYSAKENCKLNNINNIKFIRLAAEEFVEAQNKKREFRRLKQEDVSLDDYNFSSIFVDPPRAGLDDTTRKLVSEFNQIIYISCNPETLKRDLDEITMTHRIKKFAFFDQFAYSNHIESGVILTKK
jgi:tRNA (uracil-5-)-methyltransferase